MTVDQANNLYIADFDNHRIRKVFAATGIIATLNQPSSLAVDEGNNLYIADENNHGIRKIILATGIITTVAGSGIGGLSGDGGLATVAQLNHPTGLALDGLGNLYITDLSNHRVRKLEDPKIFLPIIIKDAEISTL